MAERFRQDFDRWAGVVRRRLAARLALSVASAVWTACALAALVGWLVGYPAVARIALIVALAAPLAALLVARRRRWSDGDVALFLDARLARDESVSTAVALDPSAVAYAAVVARATATLTAARASEVRPALLRRIHVLAPLALAAVVLGVLAPPRGRAVAARPPGSDVVRADAVPGLVRVEHVRELPAASPAQRARLDRIAEDARRLREQLQGHGLERREALARTAELRERVAAERLAFASPEERRGLESAIERLRSAGLADAARALGDHDPAALDRATAREANRVEQADRERAHQALGDAADAAQREGAGEVARTLQQQRERAEQRAARNAALEQIARAMGADAQVAAALQRFERERTDDAARDLARVIAASMGAMNEAQRGQLAQRLRQSAGGNPSGSPSGSHGGAPPGSSGAPDANAMVRALADALEGRSPGGASPSSQMPQGPGATQPGPGSQGLGDAEGGAQSAEQQLGGAGGSEAQGDGTGSPSGSGSPGSRGGSGGGDGRSGAGGSRGAGGPSGTGAPSPGAGAGGSGPGGGAGSHGGSTAPIAGGETIRAQARAGVHGGVAQPGGTTTLAPGRAGESANVRGTGELQGVAPAEIQGVESSQVPAEYRDQVRQYFRP